MRAVSLAFSLFLAVAGQAVAELTVEQRVSDFQNLATVYARNYAPSEWKKTAVGVDPLAIGAWLQRVRAAKSDLEYMDLCVQYVASFRDTHTRFSWLTSFSADSGLTVDLYDGKVLVDGINRAILPAAQFPIAVGDEILAVDGKPAAELMDEFLPNVNEANDRFRRRRAADLLVYRPQTMWPKAADLSETSVFQVRHRAGNTASYTVTWRRLGVAVRELFPPRLPSATALASDTPAGSLDDFWRVEAEPTPGDLRRARMAANPSEVEGSLAEATIYQIGSRLPLFNVPANFTVRRGAAAADNFFTATYEVGGKRIGFLRISTFAPASTAAALAELTTEVLFFNANTDGLIIDVTANGGGDMCYLRNVLALLIPNRFTFTRVQVRPALRWVGYYGANLSLARLGNAPQDQINGWQRAFDEATAAYRAGASLSQPLPICVSNEETDPVTSGGLVIAYSKPLMVLADDLTISAADAFASVIQDNSRGPIVGFPTSGAGGTVISGFTPGIFSEGSTSVTVSMMVRRAPVNYPGVISTPYVENIGVWPDVYLDRLTEANLVGGGRNWVNDFTGVMLGILTR